MKIIKKGILSNNEQFDLKFVCPQCGCEFIANTSECQSNKEFRMPWSDLEYKYMCPENYCNKICFATIKNKYIENPNPNYKPPPLKPFK